MRDLRSQQGFTLIEAVLAIGIIAVGIIGLQFSMQGASRNSLIADQSLVATHLAQETIERIIAYRDENGYTSALTAINTSNTFDEDPVTGFPNYAIDSTALEVDPDDDNSEDDFLDASSGSGYARVTVNVSWNGGNNSIDLVTLIAEYTVP